MSGLSTWRRVFVFFYYESDFYSTALYFFQFDYSVASCVIFRGPFLFGRISLSVYLLAHWIVRIPHLSKAMHMATEKRPLSDEQAVRSLEDNQQRTELFIM
ncbi:unnamed protein product [Pylaiella littoralis]